MSRILKNNTWWIISILFIIVSLSEVFVGIATIGHKGITGYFAIVEVIFSLILIATILYCLFKKDTRFRILTIVFCLIMLVSLIVTFRLFSLPNAIAFEPLNKYLTLGASNPLWYKVNTMATDKHLQSNEFWIEESCIFVNINFIVSVVIGVATAIIGIKSKYSPALDNLKRQV